MDYCSVPSHPAMEQENAKLRAEVGRLESYAKDRDDDARGMTRLCEQYRAERDAALLQLGEAKDELEMHRKDGAGSARQIHGLQLQNSAWEKMVRGMADRLYAIGKEGEILELMEIATELHRRCQVIKGEKPLPAAGEKLTSENVGPIEKRKCVHGVEVGDGPCGLC